MTSFSLYEHRQDIEAIVSYHFGASDKACRAGNLRSGFTVASMFVYQSTLMIQSDTATKRCSLDFLCYKVGERQYPGNAEEKLLSRDPCIATKEILLRIRYIAHLEIGN